MAKGKKSTGKRSHLQVVAGSTKIDRQIAEAVDHLLQEPDLPWEQVEAYLDIITGQPRRVLPLLQQTLRNADWAGAERVSLIIQQLEGPEIDDWLAEQAHDTSLHDDVRMQLMGILQSRDVPVDEEEFFFSLQDPESMFRRMQTRLLEDSATNLLMRQTAVESTQFRDADDFASWLDFALEPRDPRALYILLPLLYLPDDKAVQRVIGALERLGHPAAAPALGELAEWHSSRRLRKAARVALGRLTMRGSARAADLPPTPLPPLTRAYLSTIDGDGGQAVGVVREQKNGLLMIASIAVNDHQGVRNCFATPDLEPAEWDDILLDLMEGGTAVVDVPLSVCRRVYQDARRLTMQAGLPLPLDAEVWSAMLQGDDLPDVPEPAAPTLTPAEAAALLADTADLLDEDVFAYWFFDPDEIAGFMDRAERLAEDRGNERWEQLVSQVVQKLVTDEFRARLRTRLERQAALLAGLAEHDLAQLAAAAAWGLDPKAPAPIVEHPFLREMVEASFDNMWEEWDEDEDEDDDDDEEFEWDGPLPRTEADWRAVTALADSPTEVMSAWFEFYPPANMDQVNEVAQYLQAIWNTTPRRELGGRAPYQMAGMAPPPIPPMPPVPAMQPIGALQPPPGPLALDDVWAAIRAYYDEAIDWEPQLAQEYVQGYLQDLEQAGAPPEELMARWDDLTMFHFFLDHYGNEILTLDDVQPYHLSEWMIEFVAHNILGRVPLAAKRQALDTVRGLYEYLGRTGAVTAETAEVVTEAVATITAPPRRLQPIERP